MKWSVHLSDHLLSFLTETPTLISFAFFVVMDRDIGGKVVALLWTSRNNKVDPRAIQCPWFRMGKKRRHLPALRTPERADLPGKSEDNIYRIGPRVMEELIKAGESTPPPNK
jgi:hypothetical protein